MSFQSFIDAIVSPFEKTASVAGAVVDSAGTIFKWTPYVLAGLVAMFGVGFFLKISS